jgi:hypothetical protein
LRSVSGRQCSVGFSDPHQLDVGSMQVGLQEAFRVSVDQTSNRDAQGSAVLRGLGLAG